MNGTTIFITKHSGELEQFSFQKLKNSLQNSGASNVEIDSIIESIKMELYDGITSKEIYKKAFLLLKKSNRIYASKYSLKRAIFDLGPTGYPFERLTGALLKQRGYKTQVSVILKGECVNHEIDVLAEKDGNTFLIECKFHSKYNTSNNVKIPLYIQSRFVDVQKKWNSKPNKTTFLKQSWIVSNTRFTKEAKKYARCVGINLLSWNYPEGNGINKNIDRYGLYPITTLTSLTKREKELLIEKNIILTQELLTASNVLNQTGFSKAKIKDILSEAKKLCSL